MIISLKENQSKRDKDLVMISRAGKQTNSTYLAFSKNAVEEPIDNTDGSK